MAKNLQDLESLTSKLVVEQLDDNEDNHPDCDAALVEVLEDVSLSMIQSTIFSHLSSLGICIVNLVGK